MAEIDLTRFLACWPNTLAQECPFPNDWSNARNFSNDPHDPGGATMDGIIQAEFDDYCNKHDLVHTSVRNISKQQGQDIYVNNFWLPHCPILPVGLDMNYFDTDVNMGGKEATRILQVALGVPNDGVWGPQTQAAVSGITDVPRVVQAFTDRRKVVYAELSGFPYFGKDWIRRANEIGSTATRMALGQPSLPQLQPPGALVRVPRAKWYLPEDRK